MNWLLFVLAALILVAVILFFKFLSENKENVEEELPYRAKRYLFSCSEHEFLRVLNEQIDTKRYMIFPKVRLADFIEVTARGKEYQGWWNKIRSKHVDFLIWDVQENKVALAIELDGKSHQSEKMQKRDEFVNEVYGRIGIKLKRVRVGNDFSRVSSGIKDSLNTP